MYLHTDYLIYSPPPLYNHTVWSPSVFFSKAVISLLFCKRVYFICSILDSSYKWYNMIKVVLWFTALKFIRPRSLRVSANGIISFFSMAGWYSILHRHQSLLFMGFPSKNSEVSCHSLLQVIFPTQRSNWCLLHNREILYHLSHQGSPISWRQVIFTAPQTFWIISVLKVMFYGCSYRKFPQGGSIFCCPTLSIWETRG